jgi:hypothetical protein
LKIWPMSERRTISEAAVYPMATIGSEQQLRGRCKMSQTPCLSMNLSRIS